MVNETIIIEEIIKITWKQVQIEKSSDNRTEYWQKRLFKS